MSSASTKIIQAAAGNAAGEALYVEDVFSTYLYEGTRATQTITNGIDLDGEGGLVWARTRDTNSSHALYDTERGVTNNIFTNSTSAEASYSGSLTSFNSDGFTLGSDTTGGLVNYVLGDHVSWTFRKAPKFFDVVTYTGTGSQRNVSHDLGSVPGSVFVKRTDTSSDWIVHHRGLSAPNSIFLKLNSSASQDGNSDMVNATSTTTFSVGTANEVNASGGTYVAYLFAHNDGDGEFGENADQDIIKCGSYTGNGGSQQIDLGFEPQFLIVKNASASSTNWLIFDNMRGFGTTFDRGFGTESVNKQLRANTSGVESSSSLLAVSPTGFETFSANGEVNGSGNTLIYIAIRRGPMKTPESGTEVFANSFGISGQSYWHESGFPVDLGIQRLRTSASFHYFADRLRGPAILSSQTTDAEAGGQTNFTFDYMDGWYENLGASTAYISHMFRRAPGFFDVVCDTRSFTYGTLNHNLKVIPELIIKKNRSRASTFWDVMPNVSPFDYRYTIYLNDTQAISGPSTAYWNTAPTDTVFGVHYGSDGSQNGDDFVYYLFASVPGVSKVFSVTKSSGSDATVDCGFSAGARFVMLKRTDSTGDWHVFDTERGIVSGNDPRLELNTTDAEDTGSDYIDPNSSGFTIVDNGLDDGDYIGLAIA